MISPSHHRRQGIGGNAMDAACTAQRSKLPRHLDDPEWYAQVLQLLMEHGYRPDDSGGQQDAMNQGGTGFAPSLHSGSETFDQPNPAAMRVYASASGYVSGTARTSKGKELSSTKKLRGLQSTSGSGKS